MEAAVGGWLTVGIVDANGQPLPGLSATNCVQLGGNQLDAEVLWRSGQGGRSIGAPWPGAAWRGHRNTGTAGGLLGVGVVRAANGSDLGAPMVCCTLLMAD